MKRILFSLMVFSIATIALGSNSVSAAQPARAALPTIDSIEPATPSEWSDVIVRGSNLSNADGSCSLRFSDRPAYIFYCTDTEVRAVTQWISGPVLAVAIRDGVAGQAKALSLAQLSSDTRVSPGVLQVKIKANQDASSLLAVHGIPADEITSLANFPHNLSGWYSIRVPSGQEIAQSRALATVRLWFRSENRVIRLTRQAQVQEPHLSAGGGPQLS